MRAELRTPRALLLACVAVATASLVLAAGAFAQSTQSVLVFHGTAGTPNDSVDEAVAAIEELGADNGFEVEATDDPSVFTGPSLEGYRAVVFVHTSGDVLDGAQESALHAYIQDGGGFFGIGEAANAEPGSSFFDGLIGARPDPDSSAEVTSQTVEVGDSVHPATQGLPPEWGPRDDAWFMWADNPTGDVHTLARVRFGARADDGTRNGSTSSPISWCHDFQGGRSFYTGMGRTAEGYSEPELRTHLLGAIQWAAGLVRANCKATINSSYETTRITQPNSSPNPPWNQIGEPHGITIAPDGRVLYIGRGGDNSNNQGSKPQDWANPDIGLGNGTIHVWDPDQAENNGVTLAVDLPVFGDRGSGDELVKTEEGGLGIAVAPDFTETGHVYVYWTPHSEIDRTARIGLRRISRFTLDHETNTIDADTEKVILEWPVQIHSCCHAGGGMGFDSQGNLYVTTGDNNSSGSSQGYSGNNSTIKFNYPGGSYSIADARATAGNTNNLQGKLIRIAPIDFPDSETPAPGIDTTYTIPGGPNGPNLFDGSEEGGGKSRPEIYAMGLRNPARLWVDQQTDWVYTAWVGPDAGGPSATWGPQKYDSAAVIDEAGNYGWPYCMGNKQPYRDRIGNDTPSTSNEPGFIDGWYDCDNPVNDSPNNVDTPWANSPNPDFPNLRDGGMTNLPPVQPVNIWYGPGTGCADFPRGANGVPNYAAAPTQLCPWAHGGGQAIMAGPVYRHSDDADPSVAWPEYWEGRWFLGDESGSDNIRHAVAMDPETAGDGGPPVYVDNLKSIVPTGQIFTLMDWEFGPDGALYVMNYGGGFFNWDQNSALYRIDYVGGADTPGPDPQWQATGNPREIQFDIGASGGVSYEWDFGDGETSADPSPIHTYAEDGPKEVSLTVTYADDTEATATIEINVSGDDTVAPETSHALDPPEPDGEDGNWLGPVEVTLSATDDGGSGVALTQYRVDGGAWQDYSAPFTVSGDGEHLVEYRSRDNAGNVEEPKSVTIPIASDGGGGGSCLPQSDEFDGSELDGKWDVLRPTGDIEVGDGSLGIPINQGDFIANDPLAGDVPLQDAPDGEWTATAKLDTSELDANGEQAGLVVWKSEDPNSFSKIVAIQSNQGTDQFEHIVTQEGSVNPPIPQSITPAPGGQLPDEVLLRARYDGTQAIAEFSGDNGQTWTLIGQEGHAAPLDSPLRVGLTAFRGSNGGGLAHFDWFRVHEGAEAGGPIGCAPTGGECEQSDEFDGTALDPKWEIVNGNEDALSVGDGSLNLTSAPGDVFGGNFTAQNILMQPVPGGPWTASIKLNHTAISANGQAAGMVVYGSQDPNNFLKTATQYKDTDLEGNPMNGIWVERVLTTDGAVNGDFGGNFPNTGKLEPPTDDLWIRASYDGAEISTQYSLDGSTWQPSAPAFPASELGENGATKVGVFVKHDGGGAATEVAYDWFHVEAASCGGGGGDTTAPTTSIELDPADPDGEGGWYTSPVEVSLSAEDNEGGSGVETTEYRIDDGEFQPYSEPFTVSDDGAHTISYRSTDADGNAETPKTRALKIDKAAPTTTATTSGDGPVEVTLAAGDGDGSGVARTEFRVDGGEWQTYVDEETILNSQADLARWAQAGPGGLTWMDEEGGFARTNGGLGMPWYPVREFGDFSLKLQWRDSSTGTNGNSGVFTRFPDPRIPLADRPTEGPGGWTGEYCGRTGAAAGDPAWVAIYCGQEIQINDHQGDVQKTGSIYNFAPVGEDGAGIQPRGTWVEYEVRVEGQQYTILRNGEVINEFDNSIPLESSRDGDPPTDARQFASGYIGLQNHGANDVIDFRNVRVLPLDAGSVQGPIVVEGDGDHTVQFRSTDAAGNVEQTKSKSFTIGDAGGPLPGPQPGPPSADAAVGIDKPGKNLKLRKFLRKGLEVSATCVAVDEGTLRMTLNRGGSRKLGLGRKRTSLARSAVACGSNGKLTALLEPKEKMLPKLRQAAEETVGNVSGLLELRMSGPGGQASDKQKLVLKGRKR